MRKTTTASEIAEFKKQYENISGLPIPDSFFENAKTYIFQKNGKIVGGFILSNKRPLRTLELFTQSKNLRKKINTLQHSFITEVCCFWIDRRYRKNKLFSIQVWIQMAAEVSRQKEEYILYGTNSKGLAKMYGYPKYSILLNKELIGNNLNYIFIVERKNFLTGTLMIIHSKIKRVSISPNIINNHQIEKSIYNELSI